MQVDILEETARYISSLEQKLIEQVREHGLPDKLDKFRDNSAVSDASSDNSATDNLDMNTLKTILHKYAEPKIVSRLEEQQMEEQKQICNILQTGGHEG